jgi:arsenate reductase-like glutaredoxin family protein
LLRHGAVLNERDLGRDPLSISELQALFRGYDPRAFLNPRNELYRKMKMKEKPPSREETLRLMAREPNLIRRPLVIRGAVRFAGYDEKALEDLLR